MLHTIFSVLFPLIALITLGYTLKQRQWLEDGFWRGAEKLNYYVLFPIMLFLNLATAQIQIDIIQEMSMRHVIVIGAGITGVTTAYELALLGYHVTVVDQHGNSQYLAYPQAKQWHADHTPSCVPDNAP
jgi:predicted permease